MTDENPKHHPLAYDVNGTPFIPPPEVVAWRPKKLARKAGRPKPIIDPETGRPLDLPLETDFDQFAEAVGESGRYRLEGIDANGQPVAGCVAVTEIVFDDEPATPSTSDVLPLLAQLTQRVIESNARVMEAMASAFGKVRPLASEPITIAAPSAANGQTAEQGAQLMQLLAALPELMKGAKSIWATAKQAAEAAKAADPAEATEGDTNRE